MEEKCSRCKTRLFPSDRIVRCNGCGAMYHSRCWKSFTEKCVVCGKDNDDFSDEKIQSYKKAVDEKAIQELSQEEKNGEIGMFINVSGKIKGLAKAITVIGIIVGIIVSIAAMFAYGDHMVLASVAMGVGVALSAWITSLLLYAFGELVANSKESKELQQQILDELRSKDQNKEQ